MNLRTFLFFLAFVGNAWSLDHPWQVASDHYEKGGYVSVINELEKNEKEYLVSPFRNDYLQAIGTFVSFVGEYKKAIKYFDLYGTTSESSQIEINNYIAVDAVKTVSNLSKVNQVIFINEAHHVPQHRIFTISLLRDLYKNGFRYLAAETLSSLDEDDLNKRKFPTEDSGYYTIEPNYGDLIRQALDIGFKVVAYEHEDNTCNYQETPNICQNERELGQAENLVNKILKNDPNAKILVHAGYGHIAESGSVNFQMMAVHFKALSKIDPLTIDQVDMTEHSQKKFEREEYRLAYKRFKFLKPTFLMSKNTKSFWSSDKKHYDIQLFSPRSGSGSRPTWLKNLQKRQSVRVTSSKCLKYPCLVQAFLKSEYSSKAIPIDQILFRYESAKCLILPKGDYLILTEGRDVLEHIVR